MGFFLTSLKVRQMAEKGSMYDCQRSVSPYGYGVCCGSRGGFEMSDLVTVQSQSRPVCVVHRSYSYVFYQV